MFFDALSLWDKFRHGRVLHFAPEVHLQQKFQKLELVEYIVADLHSDEPDIRKIDATLIPYEDEYFDVVMANHILEHIPDYQKALQEFYRILRPGGCAILQTPYSTRLRNNFEDPEITNDEHKLFFYGQEDHVRVFGAHQFFKSLEDAGFILKNKLHNEVFDEKAAYRYGVNSQESLILVEKPVAAGD